MGGTVAVTLRKADGTEYRMSRWTNSMPWGIANMRMLNGDEDHINAYLDQWLKMRDDYERNKDIGKFEYDMTDCYFPGNGLVPDGYGLVVVDHINKVILSMQGYCSFNTIHAAGISLEFSGNVLGVSPEDDDSDTTRLREFWEAGRIIGWLTDKSTPPAQCKSRKDAYLPIDKTFDEVIEILKDYRTSMTIYEFGLDLGDWKYEEFEEYNPHELRRMRNRILELGFKLTDVENKVWDEVIKESEKEYELS